MLVFSSVDLAPAEDFRIFSEKSFSDSTELGFKTSGKNLNYISPKTIKILSSCKFSMKNDFHARGDQNISQNMMKLKIIFRLELFFHVVKLKLCFKGDA